MKISTINYALQDVIMALEKLRETDAYDHLIEAIEPSNALIALDNLNPSNVEIWSVSDTASALDGLFSLDYGLESLRREFVKFRMDSYDQITVWVLNRGIDALIILDNAKEATSTEKKLRMDNRKVDQVIKTRRAWEEVSEVLNKHSLAFDHLDNFKATLHHADNFIHVKRALGTFDQLRIHQRVMDAMNDLEKPLNDLRDAFGALDDMEVF